MNQRRNILFVVIAGIFISNALLAELIGVKIFSLESTLGIKPAQILLFGNNKLDFNLTAGVILWPVVFITTDIINEYFGKKGVKQITYLTVALIGYAFIIIYGVTSLHSAQFWLDVNATDAKGKYFDIDFAFFKIFRQGMGIIIGSLVAFLISQLLDVLVFHQLRKITGGGKIWLRATGSTLVSQLIDSYVVLFIAFVLLGNWSLDQFLSVGTLNYIYKFCVAIILTPVLYLAHYLIDCFLGEKVAKQLIKEAVESSV